MSMTEASCIFCKIVSREIKTEFIAETSNTLAFRDIAPLAKVHLLVIPKQHHRDVVELADNAPEILSEVLSTATDLAKKFTAGSFKFQFNAHAHVLSETAKDGS
jgi:histidine triad (HIT) family protein